LNQRPARRAHDEQFLHLGVTMLLAMVLFAVYCTLWFLLPHTRSLRRRSLTRAS
jgi:hypothetical protein